MSNVSNAAESREENYFIPMTDLLIGILFIFIIIIMAIIINITELEDINKNELEKNADLLHQIKSLRLNNENLKFNLTALNELINKLQLTIVALRDDQEKLAKQLAEEKISHISDIETLQVQINTLLAQSNRLRKDMLQTIQSRLKSRGYPTSIDEDNGILRLADNVLFASGEYELSSHGIAMLDVLADILEDVLPEYAWTPQKNGELVCKQSACLEAVYVEGHTDKRPVSGNLKGGIRSNLELSAARANSTFQTLAAHEKLNNMVNERHEKLLGVSGYGESRPVKRGSSEEDLKANRRIDVRFLMSAPNLEAAFQKQIQKEEGVQK